MEYWSKPHNSQNRTPTLRFGEHKFIEYVQTSRSNNNDQGDSSGHQEYFNQPNTSYNKQERKIYKSKALPGYFNRSNPEQQVKQCQQREISSQKHFEKNTKTNPGVKSQQIDPFWTNNQNNNSTSNSISNFRALPVGQAESSTSNKNELSNRHSYSIIVDPFWTKPPNEQILIDIEYSEHEEKSYTSTDQPTAEMIMKQWQQEQKLQVQQQPLPIMKQSTSTISGNVNKITEITRATKEFPKNYSSPDHVNINQPISHTSSPHLYGSSENRQNWHKDFVKMPFMIENTESQTLSRWSKICTSLRGNITNSRDLENTILMYNPEYKRKWNFVGLHTLFNNCLSKDESAQFFNNILPLMVDLALKLPELIPTPIPLLKQHENKSISLNQQQIASILANAFFCTFPPKNDINLGRFPNLCFNLLFQNNTSPCLEKLKCILNYFTRVCTEVPTGVVTFTRCYVDQGNCPNWSQSNKLIESIPMKVDANGSIENEGVGLMQVSFANKIIGGGVLRNVCVQEEIRFIICPELLVSMLFTEMLDKTEALLSIGCERYNDFAGYGNTFKYIGEFRDRTGRDSSDRIKCAIISIDAIQFKNKSEQFNPVNIDRDLNKAWAGFSVGADNAQNLKYPGIATGNWGCGEYNGSPQVKFLIQLMACCETQKSMTYFTFNDLNLEMEILRTHDIMIKNKTTIATVYRYLCEYSNVGAPEAQLLFHFAEFLEHRQNDINVLQNTYENSMSNDDGKILNDDPSNSSHYQSENNTSKNNFFGDEAELKNLNSVGTKKYEKHFNT